MTAIFKFYGNHCQLKMPGCDRRLARTAGPEPPFFPSPLPICCRPLDGR